MGRAQRAISNLIRRFQAWNAMHTEPLSALVERAPGDGLDVGCGRGDLAAALAARGWRMSGIEPSPTACEAAARRGIAVVCGTAASVALQHQRYDAVILRHSLEHMTDPLEALRRVRAALRPGGLVLISVPNFGGSQARRFMGFWYHLDLPRHRVHFTKAALAQAINLAGLELRSVSTSTSSVGFPASIQYRVVGRCLFPGGLGLRVSTGLCALALPVSLAVDHANRDTLHAVAYRASDGS
jgi:2-polyprenyl-3-methyl-5-hydroxy-6-metoxy-1,4-benzoquinol methylase